jgi:hypothetical protein
VLRSLKGTPKHPYENTQASIGTVVEIGYNLYTKVKYDDGQVGMTTADLLRKLDSKGRSTTTDES